jgi:hypothetical protein
MRVDSGGHDDPTDTLSVDRETVTEDGRSGPGTGIAVVDSEPSPGLTFGDTAALTDGETTPSQPGDGHRVEVGPVG